MTEACFIRAEEPVQPRVQNALLVRCVGEVGVVADVHAHHAHGADDLRGRLAVRRAPAIEAVVIAHRLNTGRGLVAEDDIIALLQLCLDLCAVCRVVDVRIQALHQHCNHVDAPAVRAVGMVENGLQKIFSRPLGILGYGVIAHVQRNQRKDRSVNGVAAVIFVKLLHQIVDNLSACILERLSVAVGI